MKSIAFHLNNLERGGSERVVVTLASCFAQAGYRVMIVTEDYGHHEFTLPEKAERFHAGLREEDKGKGRLSKFFLRIRYLREFLETARPDIVVTFAHKADYRALMAAKKTDTPVVCAIRTDPENYYSGFGDRFLVKTLFPRAAGAVFQTEGQRQFFKPLLQENSCIILNPIDEKYCTANST